MEKKELALILHGSIWSLKNERYIDDLSHLLTNPKNLNFTFEDLKNSYFSDFDEVSEVENTFIKEMYNSIAMRYVNYHKTICVDMREHVNNVRNYFDINDLVDSYL